MNQPAKFSGYLIAALALIAVVGLSIQNGQLRKDLAQLNAADSDESVTVLESAPAKDLSLQTNPVIIEGQLMEIETDEVQTGAAPFVEPPVQAPEKSRVKSKPRSYSPPSIDDIREGITLNGGVRAAFRAATNGVYADLYNSLDLDPDTRDLLSNLLLDSQLEEFVLRQYAFMLGDATWSEYYRWVQDERDLLASEVAPLLNPEQSAIYAEYLARIDVRALEVTARDQIRPFTSRLTPENLDLVVQVVVEEFATEQEILRNSDAIINALSPFQYQLLAMETIEDRLGLILEEDQLRELDEWFRGSDDLRQLFDQVPLTGPEKSAA